MKVFVAGNLGYIGTTLSAMLRQSGYDVVGCDCAYFADGFIKSNLTDFVAENVKKQLYKDVRDITKADLEGCDAVVDYSGLANDPASDLNPEWTDQINHLSPANLATLAKSCNIPRFVFASSCSIYGAQTGDAFVGEESPLVPVSAYAKAKIEVEKDVRPLADRSFAPVFLRNATVFGVSYRQRFDLVVNNLTGWAYTTGKVKLLSAGTSWRPSLHVQDAARAIIAAIDSPADQVGGQSYNIGMDSENFLVLDIAKMVKQIVPNCELEVGTDAPIDPRSYRVSFKKARENLKLFKPEMTVKHGIRELYDFFQQIKLDQSKFTDTRFYGVDTIKKLIAEKKVDASLRLNQR